jgi:plasmid rolling circle replication initiator protein Rep
MSLAHFGRTCGCIGQGAVIVPDDIPKLGDPLLDVSESTRRVRPWSAYKRMSRATAIAYEALYRSIGDEELREVASRMRDCGSYLRFVRYEDTSGRQPAPIRRLKTMQACHARLCVTCNWRRSRKMQRELSQVTTRYFEEHPDHCAIHLVLTVRNRALSDFTGEVIDDLLDSFDRFMKRRPIQRVVSAHFRALEVTLPKRQSVHGHFHVLIFCPQEAVERGSDLYISQNEWCEFWQESARLPYKPVCYVRRVPVDRVHEVAKYVCKPSDYLTEIGDQGQRGKARWRADPAMVEALHYALRNRRMVAWSRALREIRKALALEEEPDVETEDLTDAGRRDVPAGFEPVCIETYGWLEGAERYGFVKTEALEEDGDDGG